MEKKPTATELLTIFGEFAEMEIEDAVSIQYQEGETPAFFEMTMQNGKRFNVMVMEAHVKETLAVKRTKL